MSTQPSNPQYFRLSRQDIIDQAKRNLEQIEFRSSCRQDEIDSINELDSEDIAKPAL